MFAGPSKLTTIGEMRFGHCMAKPLCIHWAFNILVFLEMPQIHIAEEAVILFSAIAFRFFGGHVLQVTRSIGTKLLNWIRETTPRSLTTIVFHMVCCDRFALFDRSNSGKACFSNGRIDSLGFASDFLLTRIDESRLQDCVL
jgi:hypothetical protein